MSGAAAKVSLATVYQKHSSLRTRKRMYRGWRLTNARRSTIGGTCRKMCAGWYKPWWMSAVTITVLRFCISRKWNVKRTRTVIEKDTQFIKISWTISATYCHSNMALVQTWWTRDQRQASDLSNERMKIESFLGVQKSEVPCRVSSDAHEWRNDWRTVSKTCSVKIQYRWRCRLPADRRKDPRSFTTTWYWIYV